MQVNENAKVGVNVVRFVLFVQRIGGLAMQKEDIDSKQKNKTKKTDSKKKTSRFDPTVEDELAAEKKLDLEEWLSFKIKKSYNVQQMANSPLAEW